MKIEGKIHDFIKTFLVHMDDLSLIQHNLNTIETFTRDRYGDEVRRRMVYERNMCRARIRDRGGH